MKKQRLLIHRKKIVIVLFLFFICTTVPLLLFDAHADDGAGSDPVSKAFWFWSFLGRLHPLAVHFPVSLILLAALIELFTFRNFNSKWRPGINLLVYTGAISAIAAAAFGWFLSRDGDYGPEALDIHQWTGIATAVLGAIVMMMLNAVIRNKRSGMIRTYRAMLFFTAAGVTVAGHFGAALTHGPDYISSALPWSRDYTPPIVNNIDFAAFRSDTAKLSVQQEHELSIQVRTILAHNCYKCHGAEKVKGDLRLDSKQMMVKGGETGPAFIAGKPAESEMIRRIMLPRDHKEAMPSKGKRLTDSEIAILDFWISKGAPWPKDSDKDNIFRVAKLEPRYLSLPAGITNMLNPVDLWVNEYFKKKNITWPSPVDDRTYLRRIYLDIIGLLPSIKEQEAFAADSRTDKRAIWVKQLLDRNDDYAMHWLSFWNDALRNDYTGTGYITGGRFDITDWLYKSLKTNKPYNQFVKELISPEESSKGFIEGIKWRGVVNASQRTEMQAAQNVSQVFLGLNLKCASCHNSFINNWKLDDAYAFANIFSDTTLEINRCDKPTGKYTNARMLYQELGSIDSSGSAAKKRSQLAEITVKPANGRLYRTIVNRIWAQLMGRGLVEPVDIMDNEPWSQDLLDWVAVDFVEKNYDLKQLVYLIATSQTYQLPSVGFKETSAIFSKDYTFGGMLRKRMSAEQFADAVSNITAPLFADSLVKYHPSGIVRAVASEQMVNRASLVVNNVFLTSLGRPNRETVSTGRESQANLLQALELTNGEKFNRTLKKGAESWKARYQTGDAIIRQVYQLALGRKPSDKEYNTALAALGERPEADAIADLFWAIMLLPEFQIIY